MRKEKMNNKGFSLVELIIVIAIMAILIVVLAPQYLKYVERSRNSTDLQNATEIVTALQVYAADPEATVKLPATGTITIAVTNNADAAITDVGGFAAAALVDSGMMQTGGTLGTRCQSTQAWSNYTITGTISNGAITFSYAPTASSATGMLSFADRMAGKSGTTSGGTTNP